MLLSLANSILLSLANICRPAPALSSLLYSTLYVASYYSLSHTLRREDALCVANSKMLSLGSLCRPAPALLY
jgi:hypothetical protein